MRSIFRQVSKWGSSLAIHLPASVVEALQLKEGDEIEVHFVGERAFDIAREQSRERALARIRTFQKTHGHVIDKRLHFANPFRLTT